MQAVVDCGWQLSAEYALGVNLFIKLQPSFIRLHKRRYVYAVCARAWGDITYSILALCWHTNLLRASIFNRSALGVFKLRCGGAISSSSRGHRCHKMFFFVWHFKKRSTFAKLPAATAAAAAPQVQLVHKDLLLNQAKQPTHKHQHTNNAYPHNNADSSRNNSLSVPLNLSH